MDKNENVTRQVTKQTDVSAQENKPVKRGLVMEGGAMRGMFTCGVTDVWMEAGVTFDGAIGTSAGAVFGCNVKSHQIGRAIRYNMKYVQDPRYGSLRSLFTTGDFYNYDFSYRKLVWELDPFDQKTFAASPMEFYVTCTDLATGEAVHHKCEKGDQADVEWMRASASMPLLSRPVKIDGREYLDGGMSDSIPLAAMEQLGYERNVVILTQPIDYVKKPNQMMPLIRLMLAKYPNAVRLMQERHTVYNETVRQIREKEAAGEIFVVRPSEALNIGGLHHTPEDLKRVYDLGRRAGEESLESVKNYIA